MTVNAQYLTRACPLCGAQAPTTTEVCTQSRAEDRPFEELVPQWNGFYKDKVIFSYARCPRCSLLYTPTYFTERQLGNLYAQMPPNMDEVPEAVLERTQLGYFDILRRYSPLTGSYIEVGPDVGLFTKNCVRDGKFDQYWLFEPNDNVRPSLEKVVSGHMAHIVQEMFASSILPDINATTAVMIHVLDHLPDPLKTLRTLRTKLKPNACLLVVTHDESSLLQKCVRRRWPAFCLQHPQIYRPDTIRSLLRAAGFEVLALERTANYFRLDFLLKQLFWAFGIKVQRMPRFGGLTLRLKLGNMLTLAAPSGTAP